MNVLPSSTTSFRYFQRYQIESLPPLTHSVSHTRSHTNGLLSSLSIGIDLICAILSFFYLFGAEAEDSFLCSTHVWITFYDDIIRILIFYSFCLFASISKLYICSCLTALPFEYLYVDVEYAHFNHKHPKKWNGYCTAMPSVYWHVSWRRRRKNKAIEIKI